MVKIVVWSDFVCPFCYIGKRRLEKALAQFEHRDEVKVEYKSFELDPHAKRDGNPSVYDMLAAKYGMSREQAIANTNSITQQAKTVGLDYHMDRAIQTNTFDAHRLTHYAKTVEKHGEMTERLLKAYFTDSLHIGQVESLADLAAEVGLDRDEVLHMLNGDDYANEVRADQEEARKIGVTGVPFFVFNGKFAVSGAQPSAVFIEALQKVQES